MKVHLCHGDCRSGGAVPLLEMPGVGLHLSHDCLRGGICALNPHVFAGRVVVRHGHLPFGSLNLFEVVVHVIEACAPVRR